MPNDCNFNVVFGKMNLVNCLPEQSVLRLFDAIFVDASRVPAKIYPFRLIREEPITKCSMLIENVAQKHKKKQTDERMHSSEL